MYSSQDRPVIYANGRWGRRPDQSKPDTFEKSGGENGGEEEGEGDGGASVKLPHPD